MAVERKPGGPVFGPLPMLTEPAGEALIRGSEPKPHTTLGCRFGWHLWTRWQTMEFQNPLALGSNLSSAEQRRECQRCGLAKRRLIWS